MLSFLERIIVTRSISRDLWLYNPAQLYYSILKCATLPVLSDQSQTLPLPTTQLGTLEASSSAAQSGHAEASGANPIMYK